MRFPTLLSLSFLSIYLHSLVTQESEWAGISKHSRDFIDCLLVDSSKRMTASAALSHPWLRAGVTFHRYRANVEKHTPTPSVPLPSPVSPLSLSSSSSHPFPSQSPPTPKLSPPLPSKVKVLLVFFFYLCF